MQKSSIIKVMERQVFREGYLRSNKDGENKDHRSKMLCTDDGKTLIDVIKIANPINNSYIPRFLYLRFVAVVYDDKSFTRMISSGEIDLCISNENHKICGLNILEELRLDPLVYIGSYEDSTNVNGGHVDMEERDLQLQFDLRRLPDSSTICTATLKLKCCVNDDFFEKQKTSKKEGRESLSWRGMRCTRLSSS